MNVIHVAQNKAVKGAATFIAPTYPAPLPQIDQTGELFGFPDTVTEISSLPRAGHVIKFPQYRTNPSRSGFRTLTKEDIVEKHIQQDVEARKPYARPQLVKQGRIEEITQDILENRFDCSKPVS